MDGEALDPLFGPAGRHSQVQCVAVAVQAWFVDRPDLLDRKFALPHETYHPFCPTIDPEV